jgi:hypothetical protein
MVAFLRFSEAIIYTTSALKKSKTVFRNFSGSSDGGLCPECSKISSLAFAMPFAISWLNSTGVI